MTRALARIILWPVFAIAVGMVLLACYLMDWMLRVQDKIREGTRHD